MIRNGNICFCAYKPGCPGDLWQGIYVRFKREAEPPWGVRCRGGEHTWTKKVLVLHKVVFAPAYFTWYFFSGWMSYKIALFCSTWVNSNTVYESILKIGCQIIIFAPLNCQTDSREERAVNGNLEREVWIRLEDFESTTACHSSLSSNHSFIIPVKHEVMGVSSSHGGSLRQTAGGLPRDLYRSGHPDTWRPLAATAGRGRVRGTNGRLMAHLHSCQITCQHAPGTESILFQATINLGPLGFIPPLHGPGPRNLCLLQLPN